MQTRWLEWPQLSPERFEVWCVWDGCCPRSGTQSVPSHVHTPSQSGPFPQIFCQPVLPRALLQLASWISASNSRSRKNGAMLVRGGVPLAHSRRSSTQAKFSGDCAASEGHTVDTLFSSSRLRMDLFT